MNDIDSWNDIEELELMLKEPTTFGIYPETEEGRKRYARLEAEHKKLVEQHRKRYIEEDNTKAINMGCPSCASSEVDNYVSGNSSCRKCGNTWRRAERKYDVPKGLPSSLKEWDKHLRGFTNEFEYLKSREQSKFDCSAGGKHLFEQFDFDSGDGTEYGHCGKCGCWIDTETGENETQRFEENQRNENL